MAHIYQTSKQEIMYVDKIYLDRTPAEYLQNFGHCKKTMIPLRRPSRESVEDMLNLGSFTIFNPGSCENIYRGCNKNECIS